MLACLESGLCESHSVEICHRQFLATVLGACGNNLSSNALLRFWVFCKFPEVPRQGVRCRVMSGEKKGPENNDESIGRSVAMIELHVAYAIWSPTSLFVSLVFGSSEAF